MKTIKILLPLLLVCLIFNCKSDKKELPTEQHEEEATITDLPISIITRSMEFQMQDTIPSGWNTFEYDNRASETHFFRFIKVPEGITLNDYKNEVDPVFEKGMDLINEGKMEEGFAALGNMPKWFSECVPSGGSGLIAPKSKAMTTLNLQPGTHILECYVKMPNGKFHSTMGMVKEVFVTSDTSDVQLPTATDVIDIKEDGLHFDRNIAAGKHIFQVNVINQKLHENYATSDVHLAKISDRADLKALEAWMVWYDPKGFITPVPEGITFLGGFNDAIEGSKGYFSVDLKPGKYVLISEVPNAKEKGLMHEFEVLE